MLSFDITDRNIRVIKGSENKEKIKLNSALTIDMDEGLIINGHIKDLPTVATIINNELRQNKMSDKEAVISISSNQIVFKELHIPKSKGGQLLALVRSQMQQTMGITDDYSISYTIAGEVTTEGVTNMKVLATACPYAIVDSFRKVFSMLNLTLRSIIVTCNSITRIILSDTKLISEMPLLLVQTDPNFININLYEDGQLTFSRFTGIDPLDYDNEQDYIYEAVSENIFRMVQFQKSRNMESPIQRVIFYGDVTEYSRITASLEQSGISTDLLQIPENVAAFENFEFEVYANAVGAMFKNNKELERINLLEIDAAVGRSSAGASYFVQLLITFLVCAVLVAGVTYFFEMQVNSQTDKITEIQTWIDSPEVGNQLKEMNAMQEKISKVDGYKKDLVLAEEIFDTLPVFTTEVMDKVYEIFEGTTAEITTITYGEGFFSLSCQASDNYAPSEIAEKFVKQDVFDNITYTGFTHNTKEVPLSSPITKTNADGTLEEVETETVDVYNFEITFNMRKVIPEVSEEVTDENAQEVE